MNLIIYFYFFLLGTAFGSFLNCASWRIQRGATLWDRSYCDYCQRALPWFENIPILSYLALQGRCSACKKEFSSQYPLVEALTGVLFFFAAASLPDWGGHSLLILCARLLIILTLVFIMIHDANYYLVSLPMVIGSAVVIFVMDLLLGVTWYLPLICAVISASFFLVQYLFTRGRGIGEGDIYLGVLLGFIFPYYPALIVAILVAYFIGALVSVVLLLSRQKKLGEKLPLGVFLSLGALFSLFFAPQTINWYLSLF